MNFCQLIDPRYEPVWFHEKIAEVLEKALRNTVAKKKTRIILSIPPRHGKSQLASIYFPAWALGKYPQLKFILSTYGAELSEEIGMKTRDTISNEAYSSIFNGIELKADTKSKAKWMTNKGGSYTAVGVGGAITGKGGDILIIDDIHKDRSEAESDLARKTAWDYYRSTLYSRLEGLGTIIVIMQRWNQSDLVGLLLDEDAKMKKENPDSAENWEVINFPAIATEDEYFHSNLVRKEGEPLWPQKYPMEFLQLIRQQSTYFWACTPKETPILMADWTFKPISEVMVGDEIIGFARGNGKGGKSTGTKLTAEEKERSELRVLNDSERARLVKTVVKNTFTKKDVVYDLKMESGRKIRCTKDHKWYAGRFDDKRNTYKPAKIGGVIPFIIDSNMEMSEKEKMDWCYLGGIVDGEGSIKRGVIDIAQSLEKNGPTCERIEKVLNDLKLEYVKDVRVRKDKNPNWSDCNRYVIHNIKYTYPRLIQIAKCGKSDQMQGWLNFGTGAFIKDMDKVLDMVPGEKEEDVYAIETGTGNYIAWGYASSNSQYMQDPIMAETAEFKKEYFRVFNEEDLKQKYLRYYTICDPAISQKKSADNTVVVTIAKEVNGPNFYRIREDAGKFTPQQTVDLIFDHQKTYNSEVAVEMVQYQAALKFLIEEKKRLLQQFFIMHELKSSAKKEERIRQLLGLYQSGVFWHRAGDIAYEEELLSFPNGRKDDRADCCAYIVQIAVNTRSGSGIKQFKQKWLGYGRKAH